jgi:asparagine N-glycosylation enzyme membrane subunit Stt3
MMEEKEKHPKILKAVKWSIIWLAIAIACFFVEEPYAEKSAVEIIGKISNCFTVPGVILAGIGGLSYVSRLGGYDGIGYAFSNFGLHNIWTTRHPKKYKSLYEYKEAKDKNGRKWLPEALITGLVSLFAGAIFLVIYFII